MEYVASPYLVLHNTIRLELECVGMVNVSWIRVRPYSTNKIGRYCEEILRGRLRMGNISGIAKIEDFSTHAFSTLEWFVPILNVALLLAVPSRIESGRYFGLQPTCAWAWFLVFESFLRPYHYAYDRENASRHIAWQCYKAIKATTWTNIHPCYRTGSHGRFCSSILLTISAPSAKPSKQYAIFMPISICLEKMSNTCPIEH